jgi:hypothetical protein
MLPHSVESTYSLAHVLWREQQQHHSTTISTHESSLAYATAVLRSVNGLADVLQQHRATASSVAYLSSQLGIPTWLVNIRHEATHNQLPSLSVLRLAATTLLHYFDSVYWEPLRVQREEHVHRAKELLFEYEKSALARLVLPSLLQETLPSQEKKDDGIQEIDGNEEDDIAVDDMPVGAFWGPALGTSFNRFAVLQEPKSKKRIQKEKEREKKQKLQEQREKHKQTQLQEKKLKAALQQDGPQPLYHARKYVKAKVPVDISYSTALRFLVNTTDAPDQSRYFIPKDANDFPETTSSVNKLRECYGPLLVTLGKEWPGILAAFLVCLVDSILWLESGKAVTTQNDQQRRKLFFLVKWVEFLMSPLLVNQIDRTLACRGAYAEASVLRRFSYPLHGLLARCNAARANLNHKSSSSKRVSEIVRAILGIAPGRNKAHDMNSQHVAEKSSENKVVAPEPAPEVETELVMSGENAGSMLLSDMEALLMIKDKPVSSDSVTIAAIEPSLASELDAGSARAILDTETSKSNWEVCSSWDPCTIGVCPGYSPTALYE